MSYHESLRRSFFVAIASAVALLIVSCDSEDMSDLLDIEEDPLYSLASFPVGVAVSSPDLLGDNIYFRSLSAHHFNSITCGNDMKMDALHPSEGSYSWGNADFLIDFAQQHNKRIHGHVLVWHSQVPLWMEDYQGTSDQWEALLKDHIKTIVTHYQAEVFSWDVVNEAFEEDGSLRHTIWRDNIGDDYIAKCFQWAREAGPGIKLFYNDYGLSFNGPKFWAVQAMIDDFQSRNPPIPIDGIGFQMHISDDNPPLANIQAVVDTIEARGLLVHFSELDVSLNRNGYYSELTEAMKQRQKERYYDVFTVYRSLPDELQAGITIWGVGDSDSWIRSFFGRIDWPLLFDDNYDPKPAFWGVVEALQDSG